jgi:hypothetical protein
MTRRRDDISVVDGGKGQGMAPSPVDQVRAEIRSVIDTAESVAYDGLQPGSDGLKVLAGLILQPASQVDRLIDVLGRDPSPARRGAEPRSVNEAEAPTEEDMSPDDAPADPSREI